MTRFEPSSAVLWHKVAPCRKRAAICQRGTLLFGALIAGALLASGCGGSSPSAGVAQLGTTTTSRPAKGSSNANGNGSPLAYAKCMRAHGVPDFPDPNAQGGFDFQGSPNSDLNPNSSAFQQANEDCQRFTPTSGVGHGPTPAQVAQAQGQALKFSQCMRAHGLADFPDPVFHAGGGGGISISIKAGQGSDLSPSSPAFQSAQTVCQKLLPGRKGAQFATHGPSGGGGSGAVIAPGG
jgi:hypothetical protein